MLGLPEAGCSPRGVANGGKEEKLPQMGHTGLSASAGVHRDAESEDVKQTYVFTG